MSHWWHAQQAPAVLSIARTAAWLCILLVIFVPLERFFSERRQLVWRRQMLTDLGYYSLNSLMTAAVIAALSAMLVAVVRQVMPSAVWGIGSHLAMWQRALATLVVGEFGFYWGHRWSHEIPLLWRFHVVHHSAEEVDWLTNARGHPVDIIFTRLCGLLPIFALGLVNTGGGGTVVALLMVITIFWGYFIHANVRWRFGWLESLIATPAFHRWHHSNDEYRDHNYAATLPIYDCLFGTLHLPRNDVPPVFGADLQIPHGVMGQLVSPLCLSRQRHSTGIPASIETHWP